MRRIKEGFSSDKMAFDWLVMATWEKEVKDYKIESYEDERTGRELWRVWYEIGE